MDLLEYQGKLEGDQYESMKESVLDSLRHTFRPEFLNRVDEIIVFHALSREHMAQIIDIQARHLLKRLEDRKIHVELTAAARDLLVREGYDPVYGARPLRRVLQRRIESPLSKRILAGEFGEGDVVQIEPEGEGFGFRRGEAIAA